MKKKKVYIKLNCDMLQAFHNYNFMIKRNKQFRWSFVTCRLVSTCLFLLSFSFAFNLKKKIFLLFFIENPYSCGCYFLFCNYFTKWCIILVNTRFLAFDKPLNKLITSAICISVAWFSRILQIFLFYYVL